MPIIASSDQAPALPVIDVTPEPASSVSLAPRDKATLARDASHWSAQVAQLVIRTADDCLQASYLLRSIKGVRTDIQRWFAPHIESAMETKRRAEAARKGLADECDRMQAPLVLAENTVKRALLSWEQEQERARLAEQARLQAEAQRESPMGQEAVIAHAGRHAARGKVNRAKNPEPHARSLTSNP